VWSPSSKCVLWLPFSTKSEADEPPEGGTIVEELLMAKEGFPCGCKPGLMSMSRTSTCWLSLGVLSLHCWSQVLYLASSVYKGCHDSHIYNGAASISCWEERKRFGSYQTL
jgi:hypothetical protein